MSESPLRHFEGVLRNHIFGLPFLYVIGFSIYAALTSHGLQYDWCRLRARAFGNAA